MRFTLITICLLPFCSVFAQNQHFESSYLLNRIYPNDDDPFWFPNNTEVQGIGNDGQNWYITTTGHTDINGTSTWGKLWKIPLWVNIGGGNSTGSSSIEMVDIPDLNIPTNPNWHWGDPDHYQFNGIDYILVPSYPISGNGAILCFKASNLSYIGKADIPLRPGWCAIDNEGFLYTSDNHITKLKKYNVDWTNLTQGKTNVLSYVQSITLNFSPNALYTELNHMQGGEFSTSNELLFLVSGSGGCLGAGPGEPKLSDGIHVFEKNGWEEIRFSSKSNNLPFGFYFDNNCQGWFGSESPQGITYWGLNGSNGSGLEGQLHVLRFHWNMGTIWPPWNAGSNNHKVSLHHYQNEVYVNYNDRNSLRTGTKQEPFNTIDQAFFAYPIWDGAHIIIKSGTYDGIGHYNQRVLISSKDGSVILK